MKECRNVDGRFSRRGQDVNGRWKVFREGELCMKSPGSWRRKYAKECRRKVQ